LNAAHYVFRGKALPRVPDDAPEEPITFVACVSDEANFRANLAASPCLGPGSAHQLLPFTNCRSAADGLNAGLAQARHRIVVCLHQDVYLPVDWPRRFVAQWNRVEAQFGRIGVAGVYGVAGTGPSARRTGFVVDRDRVLQEPPPLPACVDSLDELLLAVPRGSPIRFDPRLGFHFYGTDACLQAAQRRDPTVVLDALCVHNSRSVGLPPSFAASAQAFVHKWHPRLPIATSCVQIERNGAIRVW
jgi:hypothetical protein